MAFDIIQYKGNDVTMLSYIERRRILKSFIECFDNDHVKLAPATKNKKALYDKIVARGGEGVMLKNIHAPYSIGERSDAWLKVKKVLTVDAIIMKLVPGKGKYNKDEIGSILFGAYKNGVLTKWGTCGGMNDQMIQLLMSNPEKYEGKQVIEIECNEIHKSGKLRHPRFLQLRNDKDAKDCEWGIA
jgi:ATP-dependent DNA ligase